MYSKLLHTYDTKDPSTAPTHKKIIAADKAWATYRDAEANMEASMEAEGGSLYPRLDTLIRIIVAK